MRGLAPEEYQRLLLSVGTHRARRPLSPVEVAELFQKALDAGASLQECADGAHLKQTSMVSRFLRLLQLAPEIRHLVDWGQSGSTLSFSAAFELSRLPPGDHAEAAAAVLAHVLRSAEVRHLVQLRVRSGRALADCVADVVRFRPEVQRRHVFIGSVDDRARPALRSRTQEDRDLLLAEVLAERFPALRAGVVGRLGPERFTLVGDDEMAATLGEGDFEHDINASLAERVLQ